MRGQLSLAQFSAHRSRGTRGQTGQRHQRKLGRAEAAAVQGWESKCDFEQPTGISGLGRESEQLGQQSTPDSIRHVAFRIQS